ncbi:interleukin-15 receptor subunit alpha [Thalassophryne amazonica]|uniref:interleukin-15 receptor subunit alpha n=1 Tax=Thalassophryne amazonica TaxID=390379 RepID=UPI00147173FC|nr:interleukin-15 receptor subunit alpha [Thalassophryne amazonica]
MDLDSLSLFVFLLSLLGTGLCSDEDTCHCPCPQLPHIPLTETPSTETCCGIGSPLRYSCQNGYVRKAGTSNLSRCQKNGGVYEWSKPTLVCISDPKITTTQPPRTTVTNSNIGPATTSTSGSYWRMPNQSISTSPAAEIHSTETPTLGLRVTSDHTQDPVMDFRSTSWTFTSSLAMMPPSNASSAERSNSIVAPGLSAIGVLAIVCAFIGMAICYYKWRTKHRILEATEQELRPMNNEENGSSRPEC